MPNARLTVLGLMMLLLAGCANYRIKWKKETDGWGNEQPSEELSVRHTVYLIGDAGGATAEYDPPALRLLGQRLKGKGKDHTVIFLGDNIYPNGMAPDDEEHAEERQWDEYAMDAQLRAVQGFDGRVLFIAGNHDWYNHGLEGIKRQRDYIEDKLDRDDIWAPDCGCGGPEEIDVDDNLVIIAIDSQWWLENWKKTPDIHEDCDVKSRGMFKTWFVEAIKGNRDKNVLVVLHHPLFSYGSHGGGYTWKQHLFPLTEAADPLYVPMPGLGSVYPLLRSQVGSVQDIPHPKYQELKKILINAARQSGSFTFASGHEHTLQYIEQESQRFIVSGSGSKHNAVQMGEGSLFAAGVEGFAKIDYFDDGSAWVEFWSAEGEGGKEEGKLLFRKQLNGSLSSITEAGQFDEAEDLAPRPDSVSKRLGSYDFSRGAFGRFLWGDHYREAYALEVRVPALDLENYAGGVLPVKRGGGFQTNSLRLEAENGKQYTMRSLDKDPSRMLPYPLSKSKLVVGLVMDSYSGAHPLAATAIPPMASAAKVYHTNPEIYYVPPQSSLQNFNTQFADGLYLVEERPDDDVWREQRSFGRPDDLISTTDLIDELHDSHNTRLDWRWILRSRLFDILINDWDRHDDQWRWAEFNHGDSTLYRPVPRDRDQAFSHYDGLLFTLARQATPIAGPLRPFKRNQQRIWWSNYGARIFDATFLSGSSWPEWKAEITFLQQQITDQVIDSAFQQNWPADVYELDGRHIADVVKSRRDNLMGMGRRLYEYRSRIVDVVGTNKKDLFLIDRLSNDSTRVRVYDTNSDGDKEHLLYDRTFSTRVTREVRMYGLGDDDIFKWEGRVSRSVLTRAIGGLGDDRFEDNSRVKGLTNKTVIEDVQTEENEVAKGPSTRVRLHRDPKYNTYNRFSRDYEPGYWQFLPGLAFNADDGLLIGLQVQHTHFGFRKEPYAGKHSLLGVVSLFTGGVLFSYQGEFIDAIGKWELDLNGLYKSPLYSNNFYGFGNESANPEDSLGAEYNRIRLRLIRISPGLKLIRNSASYMRIAPTYEAYRVERTPGRFLDVEEPEGISFDGDEFLGVQFVFSYDNADDVVFPTRRFQFFVDAGYKWQLDTTGQNFPYIDSYISTLFPLIPSRNLVVGTRLGSRHIFDDSFEFYQGAQLGGTGPNSNLRGYRRNRFIGRTSFYQNIDLRWQIARSINKFLPVAYGVFASFDHGRVWFDGEDSRQWHYSYGGGLFLNPLEMLSIQFSGYKPADERIRFFLTGQFLF